MDQVCIHDVAWDSSVFTRTLVGGGDCGAQLSAQLSDTQPRPSKSLVSIEVFKHVESLKAGKCGNPEFENIVRVHRFTGETERRFEYFELFKYLGIDAVSASAHLDLVDSGGAAEGVVQSLFPDACVTTEPGTADLVTVDAVMDDVGAACTSRELVQAVTRGARLCGPGATLLVRVPDIYTRYVCQLAYIVSRLFKSLELVKPRASVYTRSTRYLVFSGSGTGSSAVLDALDAIDWGANQWCKSFGVEVPGGFENGVRKFNDSILSVQLIYLGRSSANRLQAASTENFLRLFELKKDSGARCKHQRFKSVGKFEFCTECLQLFV